ncbi:MAG: hypothetical protein HRU42_19635 [Shewanella sp.]|nr:hypothetical protein [Shewanella sp.]
MYSAPPLLLKVFFNTLHRTNYPYTRDERISSIPLTRSWTYLSNWPLNMEDPYQSKSA